MNDYLEHYNHNHDALGRFARSVGSASSTVGNKLASKKKEKSNVTRKYESTQRLAKKKTKASEAVVKSKQKGSKSNNTKLSDSERRRLIESASLQEVTKNKDRLSNRELEKAINRLQTEKTNRLDLEMKLNDLNSLTGTKNKESALEKIERIGNNADRLATALSKGAKLYNISADIYNRGKPEGQRLPKIGNDKNNEKKPRSWVQNIIDSGDAVKAAKYMNQMTANERSKVVSSLKDVSMINNYATPKNNSSNSAKSNNTNNSSNKSSNPNANTTNNSSQSTSNEKSRSNPTIQIESTQEGYERAKRVSNNYGTGGWTNYDSRGNEWTSYDYRPSPSSSRSTSSSNSSGRADEIMKQYPDYNDDWKKRKSRY